MGQVLEARTIERGPDPNQVDQLKVATQLLRNMGFFLSDFTGNTSSYSELTIAQEGIPYTSIYNEPPIESTLRFKASNASSEPFKYVVVDKKTRDASPSYGSVLYYGRQVIKILKGHIHFVTQTWLRFYQDVETNFARLELPESLIDTHAVVFGSSRVVGLEFRPKVPSNRNIPSTQHGRVTLIPLPASPRTT
ncbi:hypothetical protein HYT02_02010 [Candidatus Gottesmanbacteria bacterium]|nr:hypothetical protein [Candidatus Gottesmanbacteria bacterium]